MKTEIPDNKCKNSTKKLAYPYEYFNCLDDYQKPVDRLKEEDFFSKPKNDYPSDKEIGKTKKLLNCLIITMEKD